MMYGPHLRSRRERRGWSRSELAQALRSTVDLIAEWEGDISLPPPVMQAALDQLLGKIDRSLEQVVEMNTSSQDNVVTFLLLPHSGGGASPLLRPAPPFPLYDPFLPPP